MDADEDGVGSDHAAEALRYLGATKARSHATEVEEVVMNTQLTYATKLRSVERLAGLMAGWLIRRCA